MKWSVGADEIGELEARRFDHRNDTGDIILQQIGGITILYIFPFLNVLVLSQVLGCPISKYIFISRTGKTRGWRLINK